MLKKDINVLHAKLDHPSKVITHANGCIMKLVAQVHLSPVNIVLWERQKGGVSKKAVEHSKILEERLFFDISSPLTPTDSNDYVWSYFQKKV